MKTNLLLTLMFFYFISGIHSQQNSLHFDGQNDFVNVSSIAPSMVGLKEFSFEAWVKPNTFQPQPYGMIFSSNSITGQLNRFVFRLGGPLDDINNSITLNIPIGSTANKISGTVNVLDGNCHHVAWTYNNGISKLYIDGIFQDSMIQELEFLETDRFSFGQEFDPPGFTPSDFYRGTLDECRIWNYAINESQIEKNLNNEISSTSDGLINYYQFNQGIGGGNNASEIVLLNSANPIQAGILVNFGLNNTSSNFVETDCPIDPEVIVSVDFNSPNLFDLNIYPNPAGNFFYLGLNIDGKVKVQVMNNMGQIVMEEDVVFNSNEIRFDASQLKNGNYILQLQLENTNQVVRKKMVILK